MKERPILFSAQMILALLAGQKTVTRRAIRTKLTDRFDEPRGDGDIQDGYPFVECNGDYQSAVCFCPYGQPGDRLWVRETFMDLLGTGVEHRPTIDSPIQRYCYSADVRPGSFADDTRKDYGLKWKPSIHMPRAASRILLEITSVRVERLQAISDEECVAEGCGIGPGAIGVKLTVPPGASLPRAMFAELWKSINGASAWDANPWVWVVEFKKVMP